MMNGMQSLSYWQEYFNEPTGSTLSVFTSIMTLGSLGALPFIPPICDKLGRKFGIIIGSVIVLLGVGLQTGANSFDMFIAGRFVIGFGMAITLGAAPILLAELAHPQHRAIITTLMGVAWFIGSFTASWVTFGTLRIQSHWSWRLPSLLQCACTLFILPMMYWVPESPRFLIDKDKTDEAKNILVKYHAEGDEHDELVHLEYQEIYTTLQLDKHLGKSTSYADFLRTPGNRKRVMLVIAMCLFQQWSGGGLVVSATVAGTACPILTDLRDTTRSSSSKALASRIHKTNLVSTVAFVRGLSWSMPSSLSSSISLVGVRSC